MKKNILLLLTFLTCYNAFTQTNDAALKNLVINAFNHFPRFKELEQTSFIAKSKIDLISSNRNPIVNANGSFTYLNPINEITFNGNKVQLNPHENYNTNISANYLLFDFGNTKLNLDKAKLELQNTNHNTDGAKAQIAYQVANIYFNMVYLQQAISIQDTVVNFLQKNQADIKVKIKLGDALLFDDLTIQAAIDQELNKKNDIENTLQKQANLLYYLAGSNAVLTTNFNFKANTLAIDYLLSAAKANNLDFQLQSDKIKIAEAASKIAALQNKPTIALNASTGFRNGFAGSIHQFRYNYLAGVSLSIPLYDGSRTKRSVSLSNQQIKLQQLALNSLDSLFKKDLQQAINDVVTAKQRLVYVEGQIAQAAAAKKIAESRFKNGVGTNLELINANTNVQKAALTKLQYEYQLCIGNIELARLAGEKFW